jgi:hypothetical protein
MGWKTWDPTLGPYDLNVKAVKMMSGDSSYSLYDIQDMCFFVLNVSAACQTEFYVNIWCKLGEGCILNDIDLHNSCPAL